MRVTIDGLAEECRNLDTSALTHVAERHFTERRECRDIIAAFVEEQTRIWAHRMLQGFLDPERIASTLEPAISIVREHLHAGAESLAQSFLDTATDANLAAEMKRYDDRHCYLPDRFKQNLTRFLRDYAARRRAGWKPAHIDRAAPFPFSLPHAHERVRRNRRTLIETRMRMDAVAQLLLLVGESAFGELIQRMGKRWRNTGEKLNLAVCRALDSLPRSATQKQQNDVALQIIKKLQGVESPRKALTYGAAAQRLRVKGERAQQRERVKKRTKALRQKIKGLRNPRTATDPDKNELLPSVKLERFRAESERLRALFDQKARQRDEKQKTKDRAIFADWEARQRAACPSGPSSPDERRPSVRRTRLDLGGSSPRSSAKPRQKKGSREADAPPRARNTAPAMETLADPQKPRHGHTRGPSGVRPLL